MQQISIALSLLSVGTKAPQTRALSRPVASAPVPVVPLVFCFAAAGAWETLKPCSGGCLKGGKQHQILGSTVEAQTFFSASDSIA